METGRKKQEDIMEHLEERFRHLGIRSRTQKRIVEILYNLSGWSKRVDLLQEEVRKSLNRDGVGTDRLNLYLQELNDLGLIVNRRAEAPRVALNKEVWSLNPRVILFVNGVTEHLLQEMRSDAKLSGILREVKSKIRASNKLPEPLGNRTYEILVTCALRRHPEWEFRSGKILRKGVTRASAKEDPKDRLSVPRATDIKGAKMLNERSKPEGPSVTEANEHIMTIERHVYHEAKEEALSLPRGIALEVVPKDILLANILVPAFGKDLVRCFELFTMIDVHLSLGRCQRIFVTVRRNASHEKELWLYSVCGALEPVKRNLADLLSHNNECGAFKVTLLDLPLEMHIGVCVSLDTSIGWKKKLPPMARNLAVFGDRLEEVYWSQDKF